MGIDSPAPPTSMDRPERVRIWDAFSASFSLTFSINWGSQGLGLPAEEKLPNTIAQQSALMDVIALKDFMAKI
ncbi:MAG: hypothetical protein C5B49_01580 [Bdellovibrio sp.]|nr:MAG: hypothetical protein C5B49_01580 [Bdellovibrio sp.]